MASMKHRMLPEVACAVLMLLLAPPVRAGYWSEPDGTAPSGHFTWDDGHDINGSFGDPYVTPDDRIIFDPALCGVSAIDGGTDQIGDAVMFNIHIVPGYRLGDLEVRPYGDYLLQGDGSQLDLSAGLGLDELHGQPDHPEPRSLSGALKTAPVAFPLLCQGDTLQGSWVGLSTISTSDQTPPLVNDLHISLSALLSAEAAQSGYANMNMFFQVGRIEFAVIPVPEPISLMLLIIVSLTLPRRQARRCFR